MTDQPVRMDKWLWAARIFKTRSLAADACRLGKVSVNGVPAKASREVKMNDVVAVRKDELTRTFRVLRPLPQRLGAAAVKTYLEDLTPESELAKARERRSFPPAFHRPKGAGRPTKKERRKLNDILEPS